MFSSYFPLFPSIIPPPTHTLLSFSLDLTQTSSAMHLMSLAATRTRPSRQSAAGTWWNWLRPWPLTCPQRKRRLCLTSTCPFITPSTWPTWGESWAWYWKRSRRMRCSSPSSCRPCTTQVRQERRSQMCITFYLSSSSLLIIQCHEMTSPSYCLSISVLRCGLHKHLPLSKSGLLARWRWGGGRRPEAGCWPPVGAVCLSARVQGCQQTHHGSPVSCACKLYTTHSKTHLHTHFPLRLQLLLLHQSSAHSDIS